MHNLPKLNITGAEVLTTANYDAVVAMLESASTVFEQGYIETITPDCEQGIIYIDTQYGEHPTVVREGFTVLIIGGMVAIILSPSECEVMLVDEG